MFSASEQSFHQVFKMLSPHFSTLSALIMNCEWKLHLVLGKAVVGISQSDLIILNLKWRDSKWEWIVFFYFLSFLDLMVMFIASVFIMSKHNPKS